VRAEDVARVEVFFRDGQGSRQHHHPVVQLQVAAGAAPILVVGYKEVTLGTILPAEEGAD